LVSSGPYHAERSATSGGKAESVVKPLVTELAALIARWILARPLRSRVRGPVCQAVGYLLWRSK